LRHTSHASVASVSPVVGRATLCIFTIDWYVIINSEAHGGKGSERCRIEVEVHTNDCE
jgi:hypothetical protein